MFAGGFNGIFTPSSLFAAGEQGLWYDPSDLTTMFEDAGGTTAVHVPGNGTADSPVGLIYDKSKGTPTFGSEVVTNGNFASGTTGWSIYQQAGVGTLTASAGVATLTNSATATFGTAYQAIPTTIGVAYRVTGILVSSTGTVFNALRKSDDMPATVNVVSIYSVNGALSANTNCAGWFVATASTTYISVQTNGASKSISFKDISVKALPGNPAIQTTSTARPTLSARYNLLTATSTLATQSVTTVATTYTLTFSGAGTITLSGTKTGTYSAGTNTLSGVTAGTLTLTVSGTVTNADLRVSNDGVGLPAYQSVTNANTYDSTGFPYYLKSDGVDDNLVTVTTNILNGINVLSVFCGVRRYNTSSSASAIVSNSDGATLVAGTFSIQGHNTFASPASAYAVSSAGTTEATTSVPRSSYPEPLTTVTTGLCSISAPYSTLRLNGSQVATNTATQGTGNYNGARSIAVFKFSSGTAYYFSGALYGLIVRGATSTATQISNTETWMNSKTKAY